MQRGQPQPRRRDVPEALDRGVEVRVLVEPVDLRLQVPALLVLLLAANSGGGEGAEQGRSSDRQLWQNIRVESEGRLSPEIRTRCCKRMQLS